MKVEAAFLPLCNQSSGWKPLLPWLRLYIRHGRIKKTCARRGERPLQLRNDVSVLPALAARVAVSFCLRCRCRSFSGMDRSIVCGRGIFRSRHSRRANHLVDRFPGAGACPCFCRDNRLLLAQTLSPCRRRWHRPGVAVIAGTGAKSYIDKLIAGIEPKFAAEVSTLQKMKAAETNDPVAEKLK